MDFNTFCNVCFGNENLIELCPEEYEIIINILISFIGEQELITRYKIYLCTTCSERLKHYDNFRKMCFMNLVQFRQIYKQLKKKLEMCNDPDLDIKLNKFVQENVYKSKKGANQCVNLSKLKSTKSVLSIEETNSYVFEDGSSVNNANKVYIKSEFFDESLNDLEYPNSENVGKKREINNYSDEGNCPFNIKTEIIEEARPLEDIKTFDEFSISSDSIETKLHSEIDLGISRNILPPQEEQKSDDYLEKKIEGISPGNISLEKYEEDQKSSAVKNILQQNSSPESFEQDGNTEQNRIGSNDLPYKCIVCEKGFKLKSVLDTHLIVHSIQRLYKCSVCQQTFISSNELRTHMKSYESGRPFKCNDCKLSFETENKLIKHQMSHTREKSLKCNSSLTTESSETLNTTEKIHQCPMCEKTFSAVSSLNRHVRVHTGEKPYKCTLCEKSFAQFANLKIHERVHTGEKPHMCNVCKRTFITSSALKEHERVHTGERPYKCEICHWAFSKLSSLKMHQLIHNGKKIHTCSVCHKSFSRSDCLKRHKLVHTKQQLHVCNLCDKTFTLMDNLKRHLRAHNKTKCNSSESTGNQILQ